MIGETYGRLEVVSFSHNDAKRRKWWNCVCSCGTKRVLHTGNLRSGNTRSCGCLSREVKASKRMPNDQGVINHINLQYKRHARNRNIDWGISKEYFAILIRSPCTYCGEKHGNLKITKNHSGFMYNGIDRIDPSLSYADGNVAPCCGRCNIAKGTMKAEEFVRMAKKIAAMGDQWGRWLNEKVRSEA